MSEDEKVRRGEKSLAPFETYMYTDDSPEYPMTFFFRLQFAGQLDHPRLAESLQHVTAQHPLLNATVQSAGLQGYTWKPLGCSSPVELLPLSVGQAISEGNPPYLDLSRERGMRAWLASDPPQSELWLQFHHACCDAVAALGFIDQLLREYNSRADRPHDVDRPQVVAHDDATRQVRVDRQVAHRLPRQPWLLAKQKQLARVWKFTRTRPRIVGLPKESLAYPEPFPQFAVTQISNFRRLQRDRDARESQPSVNDHLLAATFAALGDWIRHRGITSEKENLRLAVPMDLRKWMGKTSCFENCVSMIFLDRTLQETLASEPLLRSVAREMKEIKDGQLAGTMLKVLSLMAAFPPLMHRFMKWFTGATTSVVSNLGVVLDANREGMRDQKVEVGGAMLQSIDFLPPLRRGVPLAFGTLTYAGKLSVCLHYDPRVLPRAEATDLLARVWLLLDNEPSRLDMPCGQLR